MNDLPVFGRDAVLAALSPDDARAAIGSALRAGPGRQVPRTSVPFGAGELLLMPADDGRFGGVKVLTLTAPLPAGAQGAAGPAGPSRHAQGLYVLFDALTLAPVAAFDAAALTERRTAAVSAWAADVLAPDGPVTLALFGSGPQAGAHLEALAAVRPVHQVLVVARRQEGAARLAARAVALGLAARSAEPTDVGLATLVCCCTSSSTPVFDGAALQPGTVVVAIGSHHPDRRELDSACVGRSTVVVETRAALAEAGDLVMAMGEGAFSPEDVAADLFELACRGRPPAVRGRDTVLFKSVGAAFEDLAVARALWERLNP